jgi:hypothetical protein
MFLSYEYNYKNHININNVKYDTGL